MAHHQKISNYPNVHEDNQIHSKAIIKNINHSTFSSNFQMRFVEILPKGYYKTENFDLEQDIFVYEGNLTLEFNDKKETINPGEFIYIPYHLEVKIQNLTDKPSFFLQVYQYSHSILRKNDFPSFYHKNQNSFDKEMVNAFGGTKTTIQIFNQPKENFPFIMRRFEINPGGNIGLHNHPWEHEMFMLSGQMKLLLNKEQDYETITEKEFIYMPPNDIHGYINDFDQKASFICLIPNTEWV